MARRTGNTAVAEPTDENTATETVEETVTPEVTETAAPTEEAAPATEEAAPTEGEAPAEGESTEAADPADFDLGPFEALAAEVAGRADKATGALAEGDLDRVIEAYRALPDTKVRNRAKKHLQEQVAAGIENLDMGQAKSYLTMHDNMTTAGAKAGTPRQPADPKARWRQQLEIVTLAYGELFNQRPDDVTEEQVNEIVNGVGSLSEDMGNLRAWHDAEVAEGEEKPEAPKVDDRVQAAMRLVRGGKVTAGRASSGGVSAPHDGPRRNIAAHIKSAFEGVEVGTFLTVAEIKAHRSEEYGDDSPSAGAISARLFPASGKCTVEGIEPGTGGDKNQRGARKVA